MAPMDTDLQLRVVVIPQKGLSFALNVSGVTRCSTADEKEGDWSEDLFMYMGSEWDHQSYRVASALSKQGNSSSEVQHLGGQVYDIARAEYYIAPPLGVEDPHRKAKYDALMTLASQVSQQSERLFSSSPSDV